MLDKSNFSYEDHLRLRQYLDDLPYHVVRTDLYHASDLFDVFDPADPTSFDRCYDTRVYQHMVSKGAQPYSQKEAVGRALHDTCIWNAMQRFLERYLKLNVVGIMGGHAMDRTDEAYRQTVLIAKRLTERGYLIISGGGPGAMEASHLGAWMAGRSEAEVDEALAILAPAPNFRSPGWLATAFEVVGRFPQTLYQSLSIPTWYYGHEPPTIFATHIAKFFNNSIREDTILTEAYGGIIYMPGSAGTVQEIFQEAVQDHYLSFEYASPMVFVGTDYWQNEVPIWPFFQHMIEVGRYKNLVLHLCDSTEEIVEAIINFSPSLPPQRGGDLDSVNC